MLTIDPEALEELLARFSRELELLAFHDVCNHPQYKRLGKELEALEDRNPVIPLLYEGDEDAAGHTITEADAQDLQQYYELIHRRATFLFEQAFCYGVVLGSNHIPADWSTK